MWLPACWAFPSTMSTPADVLVLDARRAPCENGSARITSICPSIHPFVREMFVCACDMRASSITDVPWPPPWNIGPTAHSVSLSLSPYRVVVSPISISMHSMCMCAHMCGCGTSLGAAARHAPGDVGVRERLPPALLQSIPTDAFVPVAFVPGRSHAVPTSISWACFAKFLLIIGHRVNFTQIL